MMMDKYYALLKPDGLDLKEMREYTSDMMCSVHILIPKKKLWRINEREFMFLRRDSINKSYFDELMKNYCNQTHELIQLDLTRLNQSHRVFALDPIRKAVREQYATSILINGIHIPTLNESLIENVYYDMIMKQK
jgi:hypothetical protein